MRRVTSGARSHRSSVTGPSYKLAPPDAFRLLLSDRHYRSVVSKDNTIKICTGTACHSPRIYKFESRMFTQLPDGFDKLSLLESIPFSDMVHRARIYYDHYLRQSIPLKAGEWRPIDGSSIDGQWRDSVSVTLDLGQDLKLTYRCANKGSFEQLLVTSAKYVTGVIFYTEDRAALAATPLTLGSATRGVGGTSFSKGTHYFDLAESTSQQCIRALAAGGKLTLPLVLDQKGLLQVRSHPVGNSDIILVHKVPTRNPTPLP